MQRLSMSSWHGGMLIFSCLFIHSVTAQAQCKTPVGHFASLQSSVDLQRSDSAEWQTAKLSDHLCQGDTIRVGKNSRAAIQLVNDAVLRIDQNTTMRLLNVSADAKKRSFLEVVKGVFQSFTRKPHHLTVQTPYLNGLIEGTEFLVRVDSDQSSILLMEGKIIAKNDQGTVTILPGQSAVAKKGEAPKSVLVVKPQDAVQWALHYPALLNFRAADYAAGPGWEGAVKQSVQSYNEGNLAKAFSSIAGIPDTLKQPRFFVYRASLLLSVGRVAEARKDLERALTLSAKDSDALALQAIIAVAQNAQEQALAFATQATQAAPNSATALIALSYAQQAKFDLDGARTSLEKAVQLDPKNALAWARLAEIYSSFRLLDQARNAAEKAVAIDPNLSRTQTVLGFVDLTRVDIENAKAAFNKAITLDQTDPLPHLGLGLAMIAEGDLHGGRGEVDVAAILDPNQAIIRSYLGKAYYEEKRDSLATQQFDIAKKLDPNDPTPWFYDAIAKQTQNQPVEALHSMDQAIALNDNRAVYRSRLLLDSDLASRSTSQARIYSDLGFQQLSMEDGLQSVNTDPTNYSAHRLLADSYAAMPNHEIARVSELLQSQLLQPLSLTPIQPQSEVSNLSLISAGGAGNASFNEYTPLFYQSGSAGQVSLMSGGNSTSSGEAVFSGVSNKVAYSFGGYQFSTDGFRPGAFQDSTIANAFIQMAVSPETSLQAEYRYQDISYGDLQQRFFPNDYIPSLVQSELNRFVRLGARHDLSTQSTLLASFTYSDNHGTQYFEPVPGIAQTGDVPQKNKSGEVQYLYRADSFNITSGLGAFSREATTTLAVTVLPSGPLTFPNDLKHSNAYIYSNIHALDNLTLTLGLSAEFSSSSSSELEKTANDRDQYNPKFGLTWQATKSTTVRAAAFRSVKRPFIANQSLEPTQVAGFNQFYDDLNNTVSRRYGLAIDHTFSSNLHGGVEVSRRDSDVAQNGILSPIPLVVLHTVRPSTLDRRSAYLYWTPTSWLGLSMNYQFERYGDDPNFYVYNFSDFDSHRLQLGMKAFLPSGWSFSLTPAYYDQNGTINSITTGPQYGADHFWMVDAGVNYRLPQRHGFISAGVKNMTNEDFMYYDPNANTPSGLQGRTFFASATFALP